MKNEKSHHESVADDDDLGLGRDEFDELLRGPGAVDVLRDADEVVLHAREDAEALLVGDGVDELLDEVVAERVGDELRHVVNDFVEDDIRHFLTTCKQRREKNCKDIPMRVDLALQESAALLVLADEADLSAAVLDRAVLIVRGRKAVRLARVAAFRLRERIRLVGLRGRWRIAVRNRRRMSLTMSMSEQNRSERAYEIRKRKRLGLALGLHRLDMERRVRDGGVLCMVDEVARVATRAEAVQVVLADLHWCLIVRCGNRKEAMHTLAFPFGCALALAPMRDWAELLIVGMAG
jgi:hypothetical protein